MCLRVVCVLGLGVGYDDRVWLEGLSLVPMVRGGCRSSIPDRGGVYWCRLGSR